MSVFDLHWLRGPASSVDENFEVLCLELLQAEFPEGEHFRLASPDSGVDILGSEPCQRARPALLDAKHGCSQQIRIAYQCKAYGRFSSDLLRGVASSMDSAIKALSVSAMITWDRYTLLLPLLLTARQRERLHGLWTRNQLSPDIRDIDWIERLLYQHGHVRSRFFPDFLVLIPPKARPLQIGFPSGSENSDLVLYVRRFEQKLRLRIPIDLTVGGLIGILIDELGLPTNAYVHSIGTANFTIEWNLHVLSSPHEPLDKTKTFRLLRLSRGTEVVLVHSLQVTWVMSYFGGQPPSCIAAAYDKRNGWTDMPTGDQACFDDMINERFAKLLS